MLFRSMEAWQAGVLAVFSDTIYSGRDLQKTNSYKTDAFKMYYLSSNYKLCDQSVILCGNDEDYYLAIKKEKDYSMDETYLCHYSKK